MSLPCCLPPALLLPSPQAFTLEVLPRPLCSAHSDPHPPFKLSILKAAKVLLSGGPCMWVFWTQKEEFNGGIPGRVRSQNNVFGTGGSSFQFLLDHHVGSLLLCLPRSLLGAKIIPMWVTPLLKTPVASRCICWGSRDKTHERPWGPQEFLPLTLVHTQPPAI